MNIQINALFDTETSLNHQLTSKDVNLSQLYHVSDIWLAYGVNQGCRQNKGMVLC